MSNKDQNIRVAIFSTHPTQYHAQLWRALSECEGIHVRILYASDISMKGYTDKEFNCKIKWDQSLTAGTDSRVLTSASAVTFSKPWVSQNAIDDALGDFKPDVAIMTAYSKVFWLNAIFWICRHRVKLVLRTEASDVAGQRGYFKAFVRDRLLRCFYQRVAAFCVIGTNAERHFERLGVTAEKRFRSPYCVDSAMFERQYAELIDTRAELREKFGVKGGDRVILFSGKLVPRKDPFVVLEALKKLNADQFKKVHLVVAGEGPLREVFCQRARDLLGKRFHFCGFLNQSELGEVYTIADILVLPSAAGFHETWGLVVNEAMQFGCVAVVSDAVGCYVDLIDASVGRVFKAGDAVDLMGQLAGLMKMPEAEMAACAAAARLKIAGFSSDQAVHGLASAVASTARMKKDAVSCVETADV